MKKIIVAVAAALLMTVPAMAQSEDNGQQKAPKFDKTEMIQNRTNQMVKKYGLSDAQATKLLKLNTEYADKMPGMGGPGGHGGPGMGPGNGQRPESASSDNDSQSNRPSQEEMESKRKEMQANREAYQKELKSILTDDQYSQWQTDEKQRQSQRRQGGPGRGNQSSDSDK